jgi:hypothetical protein
MLENLAVLSEKTGDHMVRCDWIDCFNPGLFDGVRDSLLNAVGRHNTKKNISDRFIFLCPTHFYLAVGTLAQQGHARENREAERPRRVGDGI